MDRNNTTLEGMAIVSNATNTTYNDNVEFYKTVYIYFTYYINPVFAIIGVACDTFAAYVLFSQRLRRLTDRAYAWMCIADAVLNASYIPFFAKFCTTFGYRWFSYFTMLQSTVANHAAITSVWFVMFASVVVVSQLSGCLRRHSYLSRTYFNRIVGAILVIPFIFVSFRWWSDLLPRIDLFWFEVAELVALIGLPYIGFQGMCLMMVFATKKAARNPPPVESSLIALPPYESHAKKLGKATNRLFCTTLCMFLTNVPYGLAAIVIITLKYSTWKGKDVDFGTHDFVCSLLNLSVIMEKILRPFIFYATHTGFRRHVRKMWEDFCRRRRGRSMSMTTRPCTPPPERAAWRRPQPRPPLREIRRPPVPTNSATL